MYGSFLLNDGGSWYSVNERKILNRDFRSKRIFLEKLFITENSRREASNDSSHFKKNSSPPPPPLRRATNALLFKKIKFVNLLKKQLGTYFIFWGTYMKSLQFSRLQFSKLGELAYCLLRKIFEHAQVCSSLLAERI